MSTGGQSLSGLWVRADSSQGLALPRPPLQELPSTSLASAFEALGPLRLLLAIVDT